MPEFDPDSAPEDPVTLFGVWLESAIHAGVPAPHAVTLSTVDGHGRAAARVLIVKDADSSGWSFATHADSPKARHIAANASVALTFFWVQQGRQIRLRGTATPMDAATNARDFRARPADSRAATLVGRQSETLGDESEYRSALARATEQVAADPEIVSPSWTVYRVQPASVEFWQGSHDRAHIRLLYDKPAGTWRKRRLWP
nr:pyridoxal 5'-phosphate synthase [Phytoactinopolyspora mesophila]